MKPSQALHNHRAAVSQVAASMGLRNVRVFGSVLHGRDIDGSDLDLLVDAPRGITLLDMVRVQNAIEQELGVAVDLRTAEDLPARFRRQVLREAQPL